MNAYLAYLQGRSLLAKGSVTEAGHAIEQFTEAMQLDPVFAAAYVSLAEAEIFAAEFDATDDRVAASRRRYCEPGTCWRGADTGSQVRPGVLMRGYLEAFSDLAAAEADYRRGLELRPSDAKGYAGLAAVLFEQRGKRAEALQMIEQPADSFRLEPAHDVAKAIFLSYERGDLKGAEALLRTYCSACPTTCRRWCGSGKIGENPGNPSEAIKYLEQAMRLDPLSRWARGLLVGHTQSRDERAAVAVIKEDPAPSSVLELPLAIYRKQWRHAGELAYVALDSQLATPLDEPLVVVAIRRHARVTGDYQRAIDATEAWSGVDVDGAGWRVSGRPRA